MDITLALIIVAEIIFCVFTCWGIIHEESFIRFERKVFNWIHKQVTKVRKAKKKAHFDKIVNELAKEGLTVIPLNSGRFASNKRYHGKDQIV